MIEISLSSAFQSWGISNFSWINSDFWVGIYAQTFSANHTPSKSQLLKHQTEHFEHGLDCTSFICIQPLVPYSASTLPATASLTVAPVLSSISSQIEHWIELKWIELGWSWLNWDRQNPMQFNSTAFSLTRRSRSILQLVRQQRRVRSWCCSRQLGCCPAAARRWKPQ